MQCRAYNFLFLVVVVVCIHFANCGCTCSSTILGSDADSDSETDSTPSGHTTVTITNAGPGPAYLEGGYRNHCINIFGMYRIDSGEDRIQHPTIAYCRCVNCETDACQGLASWEIHYLELPEGSSIQFEWDHLRWDFIAGGCEGTGCFQSSEVEEEQYEVRVAYNRTVPVCPRGESSLPSTYIAPQGVTLPSELVPHLCNQGVSMFCFDLDHTATAEFTPDDTSVEVILSD